MQEWGIRYGEHGEGFVMSISGPMHGGWHHVLVECDERLTKKIKKAVREIVEEHGFYRPHDNWDDWEETKTTYMRKSTTYHELRVRRKPDEQVS